MKYRSEAQAPVFTITGIHYKDPIEVMKVALQNSAAKQWHFTPFHEWHPDSQQEPEQIYSEVYSANVFIQEYEKIQTQNLSESTPNIETVLCAFLLYSDSTHLTSFGNASLWPIYAYFGNISKYHHCIPSASMAHHLAYIPKVSDMCAYFVFIYLLIHLILKS